MSNSNITNKLPWVEVGKSYIGTKEIRGVRHNKIILRWLENLNAWWRDDETPWCGVFMAQVMKECGRLYPKLYMRALAWDSSVGTILDRPAYGCVVTFNRKGGGHVGIVVGVDKFNNLMVLGGNQGNQVSIRPFSRKRVVDYIWIGKPSNKNMIPSASRYYLPLLESDGRLSKNEQ